MSLYTVHNAKKHGIRCAMVVMYFDGSDTGHAIVGFNTVDRGMVYFEIGTDYSVSPNVGKKYGDCLDGDLDNEIYNDVIIDIIHIW